MVTESYRLPRAGSRRFSLACAAIAGLILLVPGAFASTSASALIVDGKAGIESDWSWMHWQAKTPGQAPDIDFDGDRIKVWEASTAGDNPAQPATETELVFDGPGGFRLTAAHDGFDASLLLERGNVSLTSTAMRFSPQKGSVTDSMHVEQAGGPRKMAGNHLVKTAPSPSFEATMAGDVLLRVWAADFEITGEDGTTTYTAGTEQAEPPTTLSGQSREYYVEVRKATGAVKSSSIPLEAMYVKQSRALVDGYMTIVDARDTETGADEGLISLPEDMYGGTFRSNGEGRLVVDMAAESDRPLPPGLTVIAVGELPKEDDTGQPGVLAVIVHNVQQWAPAISAVALLALVALAWVTKAHLDDRRIEKLRRIASSADPRPVERLARKLLRGRHAREASAALVACQIRGGDPNVALATLESRRVRRCLDESMHTLLRAFAHSTLGDEDAAEDLAEAAVAVDPSLARSVLIRRPPPSEGYS